MREAYGHAGAYSAARSTAIVAALLSRATPVAARALSAGEALHEQDVSRPV
jgi:hypothetical protein